MKRFTPRRFIGLAMFIGVLGLSAAGCQSTLTKDDAFAKSSTSVTQAAGRDTSSGVVQCKH